MRLLKLQDVIYVAALSASAFDAALYRTLRVLFLCAAVEKELLVESTSLRIWIDLLHLRLHLDPTHTIGCRVKTQMKSTCGMRISKVNCELMRC